MKRDLLIAAGAVVLGILFLMLLFYLSLPRPNMVPIAIYHQMVATVSRGNVKRLVIGESIGEPGGTLDVYVRLTPDRTARFIGLSQQDAELLPLKKDTYRTQEGQLKEDYCLGPTSIVYQDGKFEFAVFYEHTPIQLAPGPNGPFFMLPITKREMYELFGKPLYWERTRVMGY